MIITRTPYRLSLFGGGTDYPAWFSTNSSRLIAAAMARYCYISIRHLPPFFEHHSRVVYSRIEDVSANTEITHPGVAASLSFLNISEGLEIHHDGDLPARSGIGSSSTFTVGLLLGLYALQQTSVTPARLARDAIFIEQNVLNESVGIQDQIVSAFGGLRIINMGPDAEWTANPFILPRQYRSELESHILLGYSGVSRNASVHASEKIANIKSHKTENELMEIQKITESAIELFQEQADIEKIGYLLKKTWDAKTRLSSALADSTFKDIIDIGLRNGAYGGKLMGAGGGGFFYFIAPPQTHDRIKEALPQIKVWVPFELDFGGAQIIFSSDH